MGKISDRGLQTQNITALGASTLLHNGDLDE